MSKTIVTIMPKNPNLRGGCACSPHGKVSSCQPPYVVWHASEALDPRNACVVTCLACIERAARKAQARKPAAPPLAADLTHDTSAA